MVFIVLMRLPPGGLDVDKFWTKFTCCAQGSDQLIGHAKRKGHAATTSVRDRLARPPKSAADFAAKPRKKSQPPASLDAMAGKPPPGSNSDSLWSGLLISVDGQGSATSPICSCWSRCSALRWTLRLSSWCGSRPAAAVQPPWTPWSMLNPTCHPQPSRSSPALPGATGSWCWCGVLQAAANPP